MVASAIPSHMQLWSDAQGPFLIQDWRMMFGCRAAASFASRVSGFICWLMDRVLDKVCPVKLARADRNPNATAKWAKVISLFNALRQARLEGKGSHEPVLAFANMFIDDFPMLGVQGVGRAVLVTFASLLAALGVLPQGKKVLPEGDFQHF
jgi:hypothetical protein